MVVMQDSPAMSSPGSILTVVGRFRIRHPLLDHRRGDEGLDRRTHRVRIGKRTVTVRLSAGLTEVIGIEVRTTCHRQHLASSTGQYDRHRRFRTEFPDQSIQFLLDHELGP